MIVRLAEAEDWPRIREIRDEYYANRQAPVQDREGQGQWQVADHKGRVVAVVSHQEVPQLAQRWQMDYYGEDSRLGKAGLGAIISEVHRQADQDGVTLCGITEPDNDANLAAALKRGWVEGGTFIYREPKVEGQ
jgi:hypothetical protein